MTVLSIQYARWSDASQGKGNTKARQFSKMRDEAARQGYTCEREIFDDGRSAFHGHHIGKGRLGELLDEIDAGQFAGWILQVENIDRLTRQGYEAAFDLVRRITRAGVAIHTCDGDHLEAYSPVTLDQVIILAVKADLANKEGQKRSERASESWKIRRTKAMKGGVLPGAKPAWIKRVDDSYEELPDFAAQARRVWEIADETGHGAHTITRLLNAEGVPMFGTGKPWYQSRVDLILSGMEAVGYHQPRRKEGGKWVPEGEPIKLYPAIISHDLFERVRSGAQARLAAHGGAKSRRIANLFSGLCRCLECGHSMRHCGSTSGGYLMCSGFSRNLCANRVAFRYLALEKTVLDEFLHLALDDNVFSNRSEVSRLNASIAEQEIQHRVAIDKAKGLISFATSGSELAITMALEAEAGAKAIENNIRTLREQRETAKGRANAAEHLARVQDIRERIGSDITLRLKVHQALHTVLEQVTFAADGFALVRLVKGIIELRINYQGEAVDGKARLTLKEEELRALGDEKVVSIARAVALRFANKFAEGANWTMNDAKAA